MMPFRLRVMHRAVRWRYLNDSGAATGHQVHAPRRACVRPHQAQGGTQSITLPNPLYGDWASGMAPHDFQLSPAGA